MKFHFGILLIYIVCAVELSTGELQFFPDHIVGQETAVSATIDHEHCADTGDECLETHPNQECPPDTDGCGHCHCPGCGVTGSITFADFFKSSFLEIPAPVWSYFRRVANFCYRAPSTAAHLSALFQPPRI